jgi:hypothetical protein
VVALLAYGAWRMNSWWVCSGVMDKYANCARYQDQNSQRWAAAAGSRQRVSSLTPNKPLPSPPFSRAVWPLYWFVQGTIFWAIFVVGHDCGHGSFSDSSRLNYLVGHVMHSLILVPFHGWRLRCVGVSACVWGGVGRLGGWVGGWGKGTEAVECSGC